MSTADVVEAVLTAGLQLPPGVYEVDRTLSVPGPAVPLASRAAEHELLELARAHGSLHEQQPAVPARQVDVTRALEDGRDVTGEDARTLRGEQPGQHDEGDSGPHRADGTPDLYDRFGRIPRTWQQDH